MVLYEQILRSLWKEKVKFLVVGGLAVNFHGFNRLTGDLDIIILLEDANIQKLIKIAKRLKLKPRIPVRIEDFADAQKRREWIKDKHMRAFALCSPDNPAEHMDIVIEHRLDFEKAYRRKMVVHEGGLQIPVIAISDLLVMKKQAGRERDKIDIQALRRLRELKHD